MTLGSLFDGMRVASCGVSCGRYAAMGKRDRAVSLRCDRASL